MALDLFIEPGAGTTDLPTFYLGPGVETTSPYALLIRLFRAAPAVPMVRPILTGGMSVRALTRSLSLSVRAAGLTLSSTAPSYALAATAPSAGLTARFTQYDLTALDPEAP